MKTLVVITQKGGVGKTMTACQLARYCQNLGLRVIVVDLDDQGNATNSLLRGDRVAWALPVTATKVMLEGRNAGVVFPTPPPGFALVAADGMLTSTIVENAKEAIEVDGENLRRYMVAADNFADFLDSISPTFDICVVDTPPGFDVRTSIALISADAVVSPVLLAQECIEGMGETLNGRRGVLRTQSASNPELKFLGFLPNMVESSQKQRDALFQISRIFGNYFLRDNDEKIVLLPKRESFREAQGAGLSLAELGKSNSSSRETWAKVQPVFRLILERLGLLSKVVELEGIARQKARSAKLFALQGKNLNPGNLDEDRSHV